METEHGQSLHKSLGTESRNNLPNHMNLATLDFLPDETLATGNQPGWPVRHSLNRLTSCYN